MNEIILEKRYPHSRSEDITDAFMRGYVKGKADRPQGKWIKHFDDLFPEDSTIECSVCHEHQPMGIDENYCPNCGAKMVKDDE